VAPDTIISATYTVTPVVANASATVTISDNEPPTVALSVGNPTALATGTRSAHQGAFTVTRFGTKSTSLKVFYEVTGDSTAVSGTDYKQLYKTTTGSITIPSGKVSANILVAALHLMPADQKTVVIKLLADTTTPAKYVLPSPSDTATVIIPKASNVEPSTPVMTPPSSANVGIAAAFSATATDSDGGPVPLTYTWAKVSGPGTVTFGSQAASTTAVFSKSGTYLVKVTLSDGAAYTSATVNIMVAP